MNMGGLKILYLTKEGQCPPGRAVKNDTSKNSFISKQEKLYVLNKLPLWNKVIKSLKEVGAEIDQVLETLYEVFFFNTYCLGNCFDSCGSGHHKYPHSFAYVSTAQGLRFTYQSPTKYVHLYTIGILSKHVYIHHSSFRMPTIVNDVTLSWLRSWCLSWITDSLL